MMFKSIKVKILVILSLLAFIGLTAIAGGTLIYFRHSTRQMVFEQQFDLVRSLARGLDNKLDSIQKTLIRVANSMSPEIMRSSESAQQLLESRVVSRVLFDHDMLILDTNGVVIASNPVRINLQGKLFADHDFFKKSMRSSKPVISDPFIDQDDNRPIIMMTAPLLAADGSIRGFLCGALNLEDSKDGLFALLNEISVGVKGYLYLVAPDRTLIRHPDSSLVMKPFKLPDGDRLLQRVLDGYEGSGETIDSSGHPVLSSFERLHTTGWILAINYPLAEAYRSITNFSYIFMIGMFAVLVATVFLSILLGNWISKPLLSFIQRINTLATSGSDKTLRLETEHNDELGQLAGSFNAMLDEIQRDEIELRKFYRIVDQSPVTIVITDIHGIIEFVNPMFVKLTGYSTEEAVGKNPRILQSGQTPPEVYEDLWLTITRGETWEGDFHNMSKDGRMFWEHATISALRDNSGAITHYLAVKENITEKRSILEQLTIAKEQAEGASIAKSQFLATMSHEIRTPMNGVIGMTGLLLETDLDDEQREYADIVRKSGENLLTQINEILDFSKIEAGKMELELIDFDLRVTLEDTAELLAFRADEAGLELICRIDPAVPSYLKGDPGRLRQIITNLIGNAIKFTKNGEVVISASLKNDQGGFVTILFEIHDTGIGIPASRCAAVFEPFTQADGSTTRKYGGTGLGLSICKQLSHLMGGEIGVTSQEGSGSTFWFTCRFEKQALTEVQAHSDSAPHPHAHVDLGAVKILVVDDNATNRKLITTLLDQWGCSYEVASDGRQALQLMLAAAQAGDPFRIALLDQEMPGMDGSELGRRVRADRQLAATLLVMITSLARRGDVTVLKQIGFVGYLPKPVRQLQLHDCLKLVLAQDLETKSSSTQPKEQDIVTRHTIAKAAARKIRILLAEDNAINQKVAQHMLKTLGYKADIVADGREAVRALELINYDLVLMDCQMPELDGFEATAIIRDKQSRVFNHDVPIIALTANALQEDRERCLKGGMNDYLSKPVKKDELAEMLEKWSEKSESE
ncbi:MAG TPA: response regulator [Desulfuromonadales bacterium]|nr:response regulator [Desulfuromonadales bacterium]